MSITAGLVLAGREATGSGGVGGGFVHSFAPGSRSAVEGRRRIAGSRGLGRCRVDAYNLMWTWMDMDVSRLGKSRLAERSCADEWLVFS